MAAEVEYSRTNTDVWEEELVRELLDDETPFFLLPKASTESMARSPNHSFINRILSTVYSGPTIGDIESALAMADGINPYPPTIALPGKGFGKVENKYTIRVKSYANGMADDGYKWRKYGQKSIKNSPNPRSYYRCTNPRCNAKKQVEKSAEDPDIIIVTYEGLHLHYAFSHYLFPHLSSDHHQHSAAAAAAATPVKRQKIQTIISSDSPPPPVPPAGVIAGRQSRPAEESQDQTPRGEMLDDVPQSPSQGLLQDIVPLLIREPSFTSFPSSPLSSSSSSFSWSPTCSYFDLGVL